jgi:hypothetical protein
MKIVLNIPQPFERVIESVYRFQPERIFDGTGISHQNGEPVPVLRIRLRANTTGTGNMAPAPNKYHVPV